MEKKKKMAVDTYISITTLNVNGLKAPAKIHRLAKWIQRQDLCILCLQVTHFKLKDTYILKVQLSQFSHSVVTNSLLSHEMQHTRPSCPSPTPGVYPNSCPLRVGDAIQPSHPLSFPSPSALNLSQHQGLFK